MRPVLIGDVIAAARVLLAQSDAQWPDCVDRLIWRAHVADRYRRRLGKPHTNWGNGSLMAAAAREPQIADEPFLADLRYLRALACVLDRLIAAKLSFVSHRNSLYRDAEDREGKRGSWPRPE